MSEQQSPRVQKLHDVRATLDDAMVLLALHELGAYGALVAGPATADELAEQLDAVPGRLKAFLELAAHLGLIQYDGPLFSLFPGDAAFFDPATDHGVGLPATTLRDLFESKGRAVDILRGGDFIQVPASGGKSTADDRIQFIRYMDSVTQGGARELAEVMPDRPVHNIIDLGCGPGTYAHALLARFGTAQALLVDRPNSESEVLALASERGLAERVTFAGLDITRDELPSGQDIVILSNVIHCYGPKTNQEIVHRIARCLAPGGSLVIKDSAVDDNRKGPANALRFGVTMALFTEQGRLYSSAEVCHWCQAAGLRDMHVEPLVQPADSYAVLAHR